MENQIYADSIGQIHMAAGMIRIDLISAKPGKDGEANVEVTNRLVMPLPGFLNAAGAVEGMIGKLVEAKILTKTEQPAAAPAPAKK